MNEQLRASIAARLAASGWTPLDSTAIASKTYDTAVGPKTAHAYLADFGKAEQNVMLQGDYQSEGRNVLAADGVLIPRDAQGAALETLVDKFAQAADRSVGESYAARLLRTA